MLVILTVALDCHEYDVPNSLALGGFGHVLVRADLVGGPHPDLVVRGW